MFKRIAAVFGCVAVLTMGVAPLAFADGDGSGGSGDSPVYPPFSQPQVPSMEIGATVTQTPLRALPTAPNALVTASASPVVKASPAPVCVNNGQCP